MIRKVLASRHPALRQKARVVQKIDKKILELVKDLKDTLGVQTDPEGVGLAAPQIGKNLRVFLIKHKGIERIIINPEILEVKKGLRPRGPRARRGQIMEGCLSLPHYYGPIKRANYVKLKYLGEDGRQKVEEFKDFFAQIVLHEIDHLEGILFVDRLLEQKKPLYKLVGDEWEEVELV